MLDYFAVTFKGTTLDTIPDIDKIMLRNFRNEI